MRSVFPERRPYYITLVIFGDNCDDADVNTIITPRITITYIDMADCSLSAICVSSYFAVIVEIDIAYDVSLR
jgi:hypothetical protein